MYNFETPEMTQSKALKFKNWFNKEIGTDYESNGGGLHNRYFILFDLECDELDKVKAYFK